jgi:hypothetical protein
VEKILKHCKKLPTLLNCRLVCHIWNNEVLRILQRSQVTAVIKGPERIDEFLTCIETSDEDPLPYSSFAVELLAEDPENKIFHLLEKLRYSAKHLKLEYDPLLSQGYSSEEQEGGTEEVSPTAKGEPEISETSLPLSVSLHQLESLHLFSTNIFPPDSTDGLHRMPPLFENLLTPRLTSLSVQHMYDTDCSNTAIKLINSSKTMLFCLKFPCNEFPKIVHHVSLSHLAELDICDLFHGSFSTNNTIQCIINSCPKLQKLSLELGFRVTPECVYKLFQALCGSLMYLKLIIQDRNLLSRNVQRVNFRFPRMPEMRQLFLRFTNPGLVYYIDEMPKLTSLEMETPWTRRVRGNIFPGVVAMYNSLRTLNLSEKLTADDIQTICKFFPNLNALCASFVSNDAIMEVFRSLIKLESLIIDRNSSINDCALCGVSENDLKHLEGKFLERNKYESRDFLDGQSTVGPCSIQNLTSKSNSYTNTFLNNIKPMNI